MHFYRKLREPSRILGIQCCNFDAMTQMLKGISHLPKSLSGTSTFWIKRTNYLKEFQDCTAFGEGSILRRHKLKKESKFLQTVMMRQELGYETNHSVKVLRTWVQSLDCFCRYTPIKNITIIKYTI